MQTTRHTCRTAAQPSRASPTPTKGGVVWLPGICGSWLASDTDNSIYLPDCGAAIAGSPTLTKGGVVWFPGTCGSWLASDADNSTCLPDRGTAIAGKPDSHKGWRGVVPRYLWELACQRCRQLDIPAGPRRSHRGQARLPQRVEWCGSPVSVGAGSPAIQTTRYTCRTAVLPSRAARLSQRVEWCGSPVPVGAGLPAMQTTRHTLPDRGAAIAGKPGSHIRVICGSWLASDADNSAYLSDRGAAIAGKPDSHKR